MNEFYVYIYKKPDGTPFYVGKGKGERMFDHLTEAKKGVKSLKCNIIRKIWRNGKEPLIEKVKENLLEHEAFELEKSLISKYGRINKKTGTLANLTDGGEGAGGQVLSAETKEKLRQLGLGRKHTEESKTKMKLIALSKGTAVVFDEKVREKIRQALIGRKLSDETKRKISDACKGKPPTFKGRKHSDETRKKISESIKNSSKTNKGKKTAEEIRKKISESLKGHISSRRNLTLEQCREIKFLLQEKTNERIQDKYKRIGTTFNCGIETIKKIRFGGHWSSKELE